MSTYGYSERCPINFSLLNCLHFNKLKFIGQFKRQIVISYFLHVPKEYLFADIRLKPVSSYIANH